MSNTKVLPNISAGVIGGLAGSVAMVALQSLWTAASGESHHPDPDPQQHKSEPEEDQSATRTIARIGAEKLGVGPLTRDEERRLGGVIHYAFGAVAGGLYGLACATSKRATAGRGIPFGLGIWALGDEIALPALGLTKKPTEFPLSKHAYIFTAHVFYGLVTEQVRKALVDGSNRRAAAEA